MMFDLPDPDTLYEALLASDPSYEGRAWVGVTSTGIFCRLSCSARKPKRENCRFYGSISEALEAGFRPCKRCTPLTPQGDSLITPLIEALEADPDRRWREADIVAMGFDPSTVRRSFNRHYGMSFLALARLRRLGRGFTSLAEGEQVIDAQLSGGWDSASAFRDAFAGLMGVAPGKLPRTAPLNADWIDTPLGPMVAVSCETHLHLLDFPDRRALPRALEKLRKSTGHEIALGNRAPTDQIRRELDDYFAERSARFETPIQMHGSPFTCEVWEALRQIPAGETRSYGALAHAIDRPSASRAVARANGANHLSIIVPCHRVIGADGTLTGYGGGLWRKQKLIEIEQALAA